MKSPNKYKLSAFDVSNKTVTGVTTENIETATIDNAKKADGKQAETSNKMGNVSVILVFFCKD